MTAQGCVTRICAGCCLQLLVVARYSGRKLSKHRHQVKPFRIPTSKFHYRVFYSQVSYARYIQLLFTRLFGNRCALVGGSGGGVESLSMKIRTKGTLWPVRFGVQCSAANSGPNTQTGHWEEPGQLLLPSDFIVHAVCRLMASTALTKLRLGEMYSSVWLIVECIKSARQDTDSEQAKVKRSTC
jgi:hypothetical protein